MPKPFPIFLFSVLTALSLSGCSWLFGSSTLDSSSIEGKISIVGEDQGRIESVQTVPLPGISSEPAAAPQGVITAPISAFASYQLHRGEITALVVSKDGRSAISAGADGRVVFSSYSTQNDGKFQVFSELLLTAAKPVLSLALSPDQHLLAVSQPSLISIYDLRQRKFTNKLTRVAGRITAMEWDPLGKLLALGRANGDVFVWNITDGKSAGEDSKEAVEEYSGGTSPVVGIKFHPAARIFFTAEQNGVITLWRLVRTEIELGLRDEASIVDRMKEGGKRRPFARVRAPLRDLWLSPDGAVIYVAATDGKVYRWKVRGLAIEAAIPAGTEDIFSVVGFDIAAQNENDSKPAHLLATTGREQRLKIWCAGEAFLKRGEKPDKVETIDTAAAVTGDDSMDDSVLTTGPALASAELEGAIEEEEAAASEPVITPVEEQSGQPTERIPIGRQIASGLAVQSEVFKVPFAIVRAGSESSVLWAAQKTGSVTVFDPLSVLDTAEALNQLKLCEG